MNTNDFIAWMAAHPNNWKRPEYSLVPAIVGIEFPEAYKDFLDKVGGIFLFDSIELLDQVKASWWFETTSKMWALEESTQQAATPFASEGADFVTLGFRNGEVVEFDPMEGERWVASNFFDFLEKFIACGGEYFWLKSDLST